MYYLYYIHYGAEFRISEMRDKLYINNFYQTILIFKHELHQAGQGPLSR